MVQQHLRGALPHRVHFGLPERISVWPSAFIFTAILLSFTSFIVPGVSSTSKAITLLPVEWTLSQTLNGVDCYHGFIECNGRKAVVLKFDNKNNTSVSIKWKQAFTTKEIKEKTRGASGEKFLVLPPGQTEAVNCAEAKNIQCVVLPSEASVAYGANITGFYFEDLSVTKQ